MSWNKKKNSIAYLMMVFMLISSYGFSQNFIDNGGFEKGDLEGATEEDVGAGLTSDFLESWHRRQQGAGGGSQNGVDLKGYHSPDWSYEGSINQLTGTFFNPINTFSPYQLNGMLGMGIYELIQQKYDKDGLTNAVQGISGNPNITLSFQVRLAGSFNEETSLNIYLAKNKLKYKSNWPGYLDYFKIDGNSNYIVAANPVTNMESQFSTDEWRTYETTIPYNTLMDYKWLGIGLEIDEDYHESLLYPKSHISPGYLRIDDVQLSLQCKDGCSRTDGEHNIVMSSNTIHNSSAVVIENTSNITNLEFKVDLGNAQFVYYNEINCPNGIDQPIYWDGKSLGGADMANGIYKYRILATNECYTTEWNGSILKMGEYQGTNSSNFSQECSSGGNITPEECCLVDLYIDNETLVPPPFSRYIVQNNIWACTQNSDSSDEVKIQNGADVLFQSGKQITLEAGFNTEMGAVFCAQINPDYCSINSPGDGVSDDIAGKVFPSSKYNETSLPSLKESLDRNEDIEHTNIYPNPTNGVVVIKSKLGFGTYQIYDLHGNIINEGLITSNETSVDLSPLNKGIYFFRIQSENGSVHFKKVIKN